VCHFLYLIIFVPYNLFELFLVHKILAYNSICENGKRNEKIKRKRVSCLARPEGGISAHPGANARARARLAAQLAQQRGTAGEQRCDAGPTCQRGGGGLTARAVTKGGGGRPWFDRRWESAAVLRRGSGSAVGRWWCGTGGGRRSQGWGQFDRRGPRAAGPRRGGGCSRR
jgi:hypothetical protein